MCTQKSHRDCVQPGLLQGKILPLKVWLHGQKYMVQCPLAWILNQTPSRLTRFVERVRGALESVGVPALSLAIMSGVIRAKRSNVSLDVNAKFKTSWKVRLEA